MRDLVPPFDPLAARDMPPAGETWRELVGFRGQFRGREARGPDLCSLCPAACFYFDRDQCCGAGPRGRMRRNPCFYGAPGPVLKVVFTNFKNFLDPPHSANLPMKEPDGVLPQLEKERGRSKMKNWIWRGALAGAIALPALSGIARAESPGCSNATLRGGLRLIRCRSCPSSTTAGRGRHREV